MEAVHGLDVEGFVLSRRPVHRVDRDAPVDPGARVAHVELIRERADDEVARPHRAPDDRRDVLGQLGDRNPAGHPRRELVARHLAHPRREFSREHRGHLLRSQSAREEPFAGVSIFERLRQKLVEEEDLDAAVAHEIDERVELLSRAPDPDHVVEEKLMAVRGRQPLVRKIRPVHHHRPQRADLGVCAERRRGGSGHSVSPSHGPSRPPRRYRRTHSRRRRQRPRTATRTSGNGCNRSSRARARP